MARTMKTPKGTKPQPKASIPAKTAPVLSSNWKKLSKKINKDNHGSVSKKTVNLKQPSCNQTNSAASSHEASRPNGDVVHTAETAASLASVAQNDTISKTISVEKSVAESSVTEDATTTSRDLKILSAIMDEQDYVRRPPSPELKSNSSIAIMSASQIRSVPISAGKEPTNSHNEWAKKNEKMAPLFEAALAILAQSPPIEATLDTDWTGGDVSKTKIGRYIAMDCEMVGVGTDGEQSVLARVSIVNYHGHVLLDAFVKAQERVTDYRTFVSGITPDLLKKHGRPFKEIQKQVADIVKDRIVIGHALQNDFDALLLSHPGWLVRDTSKFKPLRHPMTQKAQSLRKLACTILGVTIQSGEHSSVEDARAAMLIYRRFGKAWETEMHRLNLKRQK